MKTLIIPDVHLRTDKVNLILKTTPADKVVFLGDWFDDFYDTPEMNVSTAVWLTRRMDRHPEDVFIMGNHDAHYAYPSNVTRCSGYETAKELAIRSMMTDEHYRRFVLHHWEGSWLMTHAGLSRQHVAGIRDIKGWLNNESAEGLYALRLGKSHWTINAGASRGGRQHTGGLNWCDTCEFLPIEGINQLFGHTPQASGKPWKYDTNRRLGVTKDSLNYCLDTYLGSYALLTDENLTLLTTPVTV